MEKMVMPDKTFCISYDSPIRIERPTVTIGGQRAALLPDIGLLELAKQRADLHIFDVH